MSTFNKEYVYCMEDKDLYGKYGYFADSVDCLMSYVINDYLKYWGKLGIKPSSNRSFPFINEDDECTYKFFYHDPKWVGGEAPHGRRVTNRELSYWLNKGNGECIRVDASVRHSQCHTEWPYTESKENEPVDNVRVRKWCDVEWVDPTAEYLGLE